MVHWKEPIKLFKHNLDPKTPIYGTNINEEFDYINREYKVPKAKVEEINKNIRKIKINTLGIREKLLDK